MICDCVSTRQRKIPLDWSDPMTFPLVPPFGQKVKSDIFKPAGQIPMTFDECILLARAPCDESTDIVKSIEQIALECGELMLPGAGPCQLL